MCSPVGEKCPLPLELYLEQLPGDSPQQNALDISQTPLNRLLGMGDEEHNRLLLERRLHARPVCPSRVSYWDICDFWIQQARAAAK